MDNDQIYTEYELELIKAREKGNRGIPGAADLPADVAKRDKENVENLKKWGGK